MRVLTDWADQDLDEIGTVDEVGIAPQGPLGWLRSYTTVWIVRVGDDLYVRSWRGRDGSWYRTAVQSHAGSVRAGNIQRDVVFEEDDHTDPAAINEAYCAKYRAHPSYVGAMVSPNAAATTLRLGPLYTKGPQK